MPTILTSSLASLVPDHHPKNPFSLFYLRFTQFFKLPNCQMSKMAIWIFDNLTKPHFPNIPNFPTMGISGISGISFFKFHTSFLKSTTSCFTCISHKKIKLPILPNCHFGYLAIWQFQKVPTCPQSPKSPYSPFSQNPQYPQFPHCGDFGDIELQPLNDKKNVHKGNSKKIRL